MNVDNGHVKTIYATPVEDIRIETSPKSVEAIEAAACIVDGKLKMVDSDNCEFKDAEEWPAEYQQM